MMDELKLNKLLKNLNEQYDEVTTEILGKCADKEDYTEEFIAQNKLYAQILLSQHILADCKTSLAEKAQHN